MGTVQYSISDQRIACLASEFKFQMHKVVCNTLGSRSLSLFTTIITVFTAWTPSTWPLVGPARSNEIQCPLTLSVVGTPAEKKLMDEYLALRAQQDPVIGDGGAMTEEGGSRTRAEKGKGKEIASRRTPSPEGLKSYIGISCQTCSENGLACLFQPPDEGNLAKCKVCVRAKRDCVVSGTTTHNSGRTSMCGPEEYNMAHAYDVGSASLTRTVRELQEAFRQFQRATVETTTAISYLADNMPSWLEDRRAIVAALPTATGLREGENVIGGRRVRITFVSEDEDPQVTVLGPNFFGEESGVESHGDALDSEVEVVEDDDSGME